MEESWEAKSFISIAFEEAKRAANRGEVPVGAVIIKNDKIISRACNQVEADHDPTAHAEILAIRKAAEFLGDHRLTNCDIWVTLEPCPMCAAAIAAARIRRLYFGAYDPKSGGVDHGPRIFAASTCHHQPEVIGGISEQAASKLLQKFFQARRNSLVTKYSAS